VQEQQRDSSAGDGGSRQPDTLGFLVSDGLKSTRGQIGALQSPGPQCIRHTTEEPQRSNTLATWKALNPKEEVVACQVLGLVAFLKSLKIIGLGKKTAHRDGRARLSLGVVEGSNPGFYRYRWNRHKSPDWWDSKRWLLKHLNLHSRSANDGKLQYSQR